MYAHHKNLANLWFIEHVQPLDRHDTCPSRRRNINTKYHWSPARHTRQKRGAHGGAPKCKRSWPVTGLVSGAGQPGQSRVGSRRVLPTRYLTSESSSMGSSSSLEAPAAVAWGEGSGLLKEHTYDQAATHIKLNLRNPSPHHKKT